MSESGSIEKWSGFKSWAYSLLHGNAKRNKALVEFAGIGPGDRVLDIGCGPGAALEAALTAGADSVAGVDPSPSMVKRASERVPQAVVREGSVESLPFEDAEFSAVWSISAFHHWADQDGGLTEMLRVVKPGGAFFVVERQLKPGESGHGISPEAAEESALRIIDDFEIPCRVESLDVRKATYLVITGSR